MLRVFVTLLALFRMVTLMVLSAVGCAGAAIAQESTDLSTVGRCYDTPDFERALEQENWLEVASANTLRLSHEGDRVFQHTRIFASYDGRAWFIALGDAPLDGISRDFCVPTSGHSILVSDYRRDQPPTVAVPSFDSTEATITCNRIGGNCGPLETILRNSAIGPVPYRIAMIGTSVDEGSGNTLTTIIVSEGGDFRELATGNTGATIYVSRGENFRFSETILTAYDQ